MKAIPRLFHILLLAITGARAQAQGGEPTADAPTSSAPGAPDSGARGDEGALTATSPIARSTAELRGDASGALAAKDWARALTALKQLREVDREDPAIPFNMGVASYHAGDLDGAREHFRKAMTESSDPLFRARSAYNLGTTALRQGMGEEGAQAADLGAAQQALNDAMRAYRDALAADPTDDDARANGEIAWRLREELKRQQQQQQDQQNQDQQNQDQQNQDQQNPDQQNQNQQNQDQQNQDQQNQNQQNQDQQNQDAQSQSPRDESQSDQQPSQGDREAGKMTREEAQRLLQRVRDRERARREELLRRKRRESVPVDKDW